MCSSGVKVKRPRSTADDRHEWKSVFGAWGSLVGENVPVRRARVLCGILGAEQSFAEIHWHRRQERVAFSCITTTGGVDVV